MIFMQLKQITKLFSGNIILQDIHLEVKNNDRIAIVGRNGAGKSTLLKIMTGEIDYDEGEIYKAKDLSIGYLAQHNELHSNFTIWEEMLTVFDELIEEEKNLALLTKEIERLSTEGKDIESFLKEYSLRQEKFAENGGYRYKSDIKGVLTGLGFTEEEFDIPVQDLSGGQKTRIALGKLLLQKPSLLILDEPTNHLDIKTLTWLENYLLNYEGAIVIVSHDRYFLDKLVTIVYEIAYHKATKYYGTYTEFLQQKAENYERNLKMYEKQQQEIKEMEDFIQRNIARAATSKRAQSRRKLLEKLERIEKPLGDEASATFSFDIAKTSGNDVLKVENFSYTHRNEEEPLFKDVTFSIYRGERVALIGDNGVGKTTLLKAIQSEHDEIQLGTNVEIGYYAQEQDTLDDQNTILDEVWDAFPNKTEHEIRTVLGNFLFSGDDVLKQIHTLSGGEKARVALAKLMLKRANFLILDEPTNHLDLTSKEVLEAALLDYPGTILFVSHDRYFINKIADKVFELTKDGITVYLGDYDYYVEKKLELEEIEKLERMEGSQLSEKKKVNLSFQEQKRIQSEKRKKERRIAKLENEIDALETKLADIEKEMTNIAHLNDHETLLQLSNEADEVREKIERLMEEWTELQE